jgi:uncharacterized membrane protein YkvA (DUF1232 family)
MKEAPTAPLSSRQRQGFELAKRAAAQVVQRRVRVYRLARAGFEKVRENEHAVGKMKGDLLALLRLARAWARKEYRTLPWRSVLYVVAALLYFVNPADAIPDALMGVGFIDDLAVVSAVVRAIQQDLDRYRAWETRHRRL